MTSIVLLILSALLVFPDQIPQFAGLWFFWCAIREFRGELTRVELLAIPIWLLIKWPEPTIFLAVFAASVIVLGSWFPVQRNARRMGLMVVGVCWTAWFSHHLIGVRGNDIGRNPNGPIVCLGDSLTDYGYPDELRKLVLRPVEDFGFNGYTTEDGLKLLDEIVALKPSRVVIELGGHDYKNGESRTKTAANLSSMIEGFHDCGADVLLVEIPRGFINDPWYGFERQLARKYDLDLVPDTMIRKLIFWSPIIPPGSLVSPSQRLSKDGLHPNQQGNIMMAKTIASYQSGSE